MFENYEKDFNLQASKLKARIKYERWDISESELEENKELSDDDKKLYCLYYKSKNHTRQKEIEKILWEISDFEENTLKIAKSANEAIQTKLKLYSKIQKKINADKAKRDLAIGLVAAALPFGRIAPALQGCVDLYFGTSGSDEMNPANPKWEKEEDSNNVKKGYHFKVNKNKIKDGMGNHAASGSANYIIKKSESHIAGKLKQKLDNKNSESVDINSIMEQLPFNSIDTLLTIEKESKSIEKAVLYREDCSKKKEHLKLLKYIKENLISNISNEYLEVMLKKKVREIEKWNTPEIPKLAIKQERLTQFLKMLDALSVLVENKKEIDANALKFLISEGILKEVNEKDYDEEKNKKIIRSKIRKLKAVEDSKAKKIPIFNADDIIDSAIKPIEIIKFGSYTFKTPQTDHIKNVIDEAKKEAQYLNFEKSKITIIELMMLDNDSYSREMITLYNQYFLGNHLFYYFDQNNQEFSEKYKYLEGENFSEKFNVVATRKEIIDSYLEYHNIKNKEGDDWIEDRIKELFNSSIINDVWSGEGEA